MEELTMKCFEDRTIKGRLFNIQRCSLHDGPGIRTTAFLKGCPLRCKWCQNPEGLTNRKNLLFNEKKCISCGSCSGFSIPEDIANVCPTGAKALVGKDYTPEELVRILLLDRDFYGKIGGVTFSGGECLTQSVFVAECAELLKNASIGIAVDTCGYVDYSAFEDVLPYTDLFLYDIKSMSTEKHKQFTGVGNEKILDNFEHLYASGKRIWVRVPIVGGFNDTIQDAKKIREYLDRFPDIEKVEPLQYHELGKDKYTQLGILYQIGDEGKIRPDLWNEIYRIIGCSE